MHGLSLNKEISSPSTDCGKAVSVHAVKVKQTSHYGVCRWIATVVAYETIAH